MPKIERLPLRSKNSSTEKSFLEKKSLEKSSKLPENPITLQALKPNIICEMKKYKGSVRFFRHLSDVLQNFFNFLKRLPLSVFFWHRFFRIFIGTTWDVPVWLITLRNLKYYSNCTGFLVFFRPDNIVTNVSFSSLFKSQTASKDQFTDKKRTSVYWLVVHWQRRLYSNENAKGHYRSLVELRNASEKVIVQDLAGCFLSNLLSWHFCKKNVCSEFKWNVSLHILVKLF